MKIRAITLLSGEGTTLPEAEAKSIFLAYDPDSQFDSPTPRVMISRTEADPFLVGSRIAFARRVGFLVDGPEEAALMLSGRRVRFRSFDLSSERRPVDPERYLNGIDAEIDLSDPELELTLIRGTDDYLAVTAPARMRQAWRERRPRIRRFFHPSAIFPKLSRALVNLSRCREGETFLDPFLGTGSIPIEAAQIGARAVGIDLSEKMVRGAKENMKGFGQEWLGIIRADAKMLPTRAVDAIATDIPYGRASSTHGATPEEILNGALPLLSRAIKSGGFMVIMHPNSLSIDPVGDLIVEQEHDIHVHKLLTRTITVLRRGSNRSSS